MSDDVSGAPQGAPAPAPSVGDRLKAYLGGSAPEKEQSQPDAASETGDSEGRAAPAERPVPEVKAKAETDDQAEPADGEQSDDAQSEERQFSNLTELLEAGGFDLDKGMDLEFPVKIDGKEGTAKLRDLVKSYQLDGYHNQKLTALDTDRKAFMAEQSKFQSERADKLLKLDAGHKTLERALLGEFQSVPWEKLAAEDPQAYNSQFVAFQQRNAMLQDIARQIEQEKQQFQAQQQQQYADYVAEQKKLLQTKVPEWGDETRRAKDKADILAYLGTHGIGKDEFEAMVDHRYALVVRDAMRWGQLQKSKPAVLNKVKAAPKLLKPGTQQSKDVVERDALGKDLARLRQSGKVQDAARALRRFM